MEYACGRRSFVRFNYSHPWANIVDWVLCSKAHGIIFGAICSTQSTNPIPIELRDALELDELDTRIITDYDRRNQTMVDYTHGLNKFEVPEKLTLEEAVGLFEIWKGMKVFGSGKLSLFCEFRLYQSIT
jgi:hypothetical protein